MKKLLSFVPSGIAILICAGLGSVIAHAIVGLAPWEGTPAAIATLLLSMVIAFALFVAGAALLQAIGRKKNNPMP